MTYEEITRANAIEIMEDMEADYRCIYDELTKIKEVLAEAGVLERVMMIVNEM